MSCHYKVTEELETPLRLKFLRFLRLEEPREEFDIVIKACEYKVDDIITTGTKRLQVKVIEKYDGKYK